MKNIIDKNIIKYKITTLIILIFLFSILYLFFDDSNFDGISNIQQIIKEELIKSKVKKEIKETFYDQNDFSNYNVNNFEEDIITIGKKEEKAIDDTTEKIKNVVKETELDVQKVKPSVFQRFFDRLYFSVITGTTLGYGDIYPTTNGLKLLTMLQTLSTIILILL